MIMTDQDHDGSHIKGLLMNFMHHFYPSLLKVPGFLIEFITPIVKVNQCACFTHLPLTCCCHAAGAHACGVTNAVTAGRLRMPCVYYASCRWVQARKGNNTEVFYTMPQYEAWKQKPGSAAWKV